MPKKLTGAWLPGPDVRIMTVPQTDTDALLRAETELRRIALRENATVRRETAAMQRATEVLQGEQSNERVVMERETMVMQREIAVARRENVITPSRLQIFWDKVFEAE
jgi:hypothetical protein